MVLEVLHASLSASADRGAPSSNLPRPSQRGPLVQTLRPDALQGSAPEVYLPFELLAAAVREVAW